MGTLVPPVTWRRKDAYHTALAYTRTVFEVKPDLDRFPRPVYEVARAGSFRIVDTPMPSDTWGVLVERIIHLTTGMGPIKARFTVCHELGHALLATDCGGDRDAVIEAEASAFASGLLMPHDAVRAFMDESFMALQVLPIDDWAQEEHAFKTVTKMRRRFGASLQTVLQTLVDMGAVAAHEAWVSLHEVETPYRSALSRMGKSGRTGEADSP